MGRVKKEIENRKIKLFCNLKYNKKIFLIFRLRLPVRQHKFMVNFYPFSVITTLPEIVQIYKE